MIPVLVPRNLLLAANGVFTVTLNAAFALGFALLGPLVVNVFNPEAVILVVAALYFLAALFCFTLPSHVLKRSRSARRPRGRGGGGRGRLHSRPAPGRRRLRPGKSRHRLVAALSRDHRVADRRSRRSRAGVRQANARPCGEGLRGRRVAARIRHRDRDPAPELLRPILRTSTRDRGRDDRPGCAARRALGSRAHQPPPAAGRRARRAGPVDRDLPAIGRRRHRVLRRDGLRPRRHPQPRPSSRRTFPKTSADASSAS